MAVSMAQERLTGKSGDGHGRDAIAAQIASVPEGNHVAQDAPIDGGDGRLCTFTHRTSRHVR